jgi:hypothetical protein
VIPLRENRAVSPAYVLAGLLVALAVAIMF